MVQINDQHHGQTIAGISRDIEVTAELLATRLERDIRGPRPELMRQTQEVLDGIARNYGTSDRIFLVSDADGDRLSLPFRRRPSFIGRKLAARPSAPINR